MIHTSGTSNVADRPITEGSVERREFDDAKDDIYGFEKKLETRSPYAQRTAELSVIEVGLELGVDTLIIMSPTIFGIGGGLFNTASIQIPAYIRHSFAMWARYRSRRRGRCMGPCTCARSRCTVRDCTA